MLTKDFAICLRAIDYSETSQVVTFFTRQTGKVTVIAKGSKRQRSAFGGPVEPFSYGNIAFIDSGRDKMATLVEFEPLSGMIDTSVITADMFILNCCFFACELVNTLTKDYDPHPGLFDGLLRFFADTGSHVSEKKPGGIIARLIFFQLCLLREIGLLPVLQHCTNCGSPFNLSWPEVFFSNKARGLICRDCQGAFPDKTRLNPECIKYLTNRETLISGKDEINRQIERILINYITDILGWQPGMAKYIINR